MTRLEGDRLRLMPRKPGSRLRRLWLVLLLLCATPSRTLLVVGSALVFLAEATVFVSYGLLRRKERLSTGGPYALTRNPVYSAVLAANFGFWLCAGAGLALEPAAWRFCLRIGTLTLNPPVLCMFVFLPWAALHYLGRIRKEEPELSAAFGDAYAEYRRRVPTRLLVWPPAFFRLDWLLFEFSSGVAFRNRAPSRVAKYALWLLLFWGRWGLERDARERSLLLARHTHFWLFVGLLCATFVLYFGFRALERRFRKYRN